MDDTGLQLLQFVDLTRVPFAVGIAVGAIFLNRFLTRTLDEAGERFNERRLVFKQISAFARLFILLGATGIVIASVMRLSDEVLFAIGGSAAVAIGFAFKDLLASLMAGIILLIDRPFQVGDRVEFAGNYGEILEIGLRTVRMNTLDDNLISIPNSRFLTDVVSCANAGALEQMCVFHFYIGCNEDFDLAKEIVYDATAVSNYVFLKVPIKINVREGPVPGGGERFAVKITVKAYVFDGRFESAFGTDITERVQRAFKRSGIKTAGQAEAVHNLGGSGAPRALVPA